MCNSTEPRDIHVYLQEVADFYLWLQIFIFGCRFLPFPKTNSQNLLIVLKYKEQLNLQQIHLRLKKKISKNS